MLRFFAFFLVFITHGPRFAGPSRLAAFYNPVAVAGGWGLGLFFFLSSYLISELLLREKERTGAVHLAAFYTRRVLRIWPLYYLGLAIGILLSTVAPQRYGMSHFESLSLLLFVGYLPGGIRGPMGHLWSISVEELFYLVWPFMAKLTIRTLRQISLMLIPVSLIAAAAFPSAWYNPVVEFLFFSAGALTAIALHARSWRPHLWKRLGLLAIGIGCWLAIAPISSVLSSVFALPTGFSLAALGCVLIFLSALGLSPRLIPQPLIYLGKISYGLYVFHLPWMRIIETTLIPHLPRGQALSVLTTTLALTITTAAISYRYYEKPFLLLKNRFEFISSGR